MSLSYITNLDNHLWVPMDRRFKAYAKSYWSEERPVDLSETDKEAIKSIRWMPGVLHSIWKSFLSGVKQPKTPDVVFPWVMAERDVLQVPAGQTLSADYLLEHRDQTLRYMYHMLCHWEAVRQRGGRSRAFPLVPIHQTRRMFIRLDTDALLYLLKEVGMVKGDIASIRRGRDMTEEEKEVKKRIKEENKKRKEKGEKMVRSKRKKGAEKDAADEIIQAHWESVLAFKKYETGPWKFANTAMTDGVSLVMLFEKNIPVPAENDSPEEKPTAMQKVKLQMSSHSEVDCWVSNDPGRANLASATQVEWNPDAPNEPKKVVKKWTLTRKAYYNQAGIFTENRRKATWNRAWEEEKNRLQEKTCKTADPTVFKAYLDTYSECHKKIWTTKAHARYARSDMDVYGGKLRALDQFWGQVKKSAQSGGKKVGILYGACGKTMNPTGRGELSVPVRQVLYRCQRMFPTVLVPENNTTKCCAQCGCHLRKLYGAKGGPKGNLLPFEIKEKGVKKVEIRGLRLCMNRACSLWSDRNCPYVDRDENAAINIHVAACAKTEMAYLKQGERAAI